MERRYRVFADLERIAGRFPHAVWHSPKGARRRDLVLQRLSRHGPAPEGDRRHGRDRDPHRRRRRRHPQHRRHQSSAGRARAELADLHGKEAALVFTSGYVSNQTGISTIAKLIARTA
jgi:5-aminolevulinate synthase